MSLRSVLCILLQLYALVIVARALLSWFPADHGVLAAVERVTWQLTEPLLGPLRRVFRMVRVGGVGIDLAPLALLVAIWLVSGFVCR